MPCVWQIERKITCSRAKRSTPYAASRSTWLGKKMGQGALFHPAVVVGGVGRSPAGLSGLRGSRLRWPRQRHPLGPGHLPRRGERRNRSRVGPLRGTAAVPPASSATRQPSLARLIRSALIPRPVDFRDVLLTVLVSEYPSRKAVRWPMTGGFRARHHQCVSTDPSYAR